MALPIMLDIMALFLIIKLLIVVFFLVMFLRRPTLAWGIGLLAVTSAVLLDTFLGTFNREEMLAELGFFFHIINGALFGGTAVWLWGVLRPLTTTAVISTPLPPPPPGNPSPTPGKSNLNDGQTGAAFDRQMLYDEIRHRFGREDILDLIFDLGVNENDIMALDQNLNQLIINLMELAEQRGLAGPLALAVERILTPPPPANLPRLEKITVDSPPTILRHYLLAHYNLAQLEQMAIDLGIDWEQLGAGNKKGKVRSLLLFLYRRNRIDELIYLMKSPTSVAAVHDG